jgi:hypothetical protein
MRGPVNSKLSREFLAFIASGAYAPTALLFAAGAAKGFYRLSAYVPTALLFAAGAAKGFYRLWCLRTYGSFIRCGRC